MSNYVVCGKLNITGNLTVKGTVSSIYSLPSLITKLEEGGYKDIMELTKTKREVKDLEVDNLVIISFDCEDQTELNVLGSLTTIHSENLY